MTDTLPICVVTALCHHRHADLFTVHVISTHPETLRLLPPLAPPTGMVLDGLTEEQAHSNFSVPLDAIAAAKSNPGWWYHVDPKTFTETLEVEESENAVA